MYASRQDWLKDRKGHVCASDVPSILGVSPYRTINNIYDDKISTEIKEIQSFQMDLGNGFEPMGRAAFEFMKDKTFAAAVCKDGIFMVSLDGRTEDGEEIVEFKCAGREVYELAKRGVVDKKYMPQVQTQLMVSRAKRCYFVVYPFEEFKKTRKVKPDLLVIVVVEHDLKMQELIFNKSTEFWNKVLERKEPAEAVSKDFQPLNGVADIAKRWKELNEVIKEASVELKELRDQLVTQAEKTGHVRLMSAGVTIVKRSRAGSIDYKAIPELQQINLEQYRGREVEYWEVK